MIDDPVVETINAILNGEDNFILLLQRPQLERIRDEIVALRASLERHDRLVIQAVVVATPSIRDDALEEAARVCERRRDETGLQEAYAVLDVQSYTSACGGCAYDIRALKGGAR